MYRPICALALVAASCSSPQIASDWFDAAAELHTDWAASRPPSDEFDIPIDRATDERIRPGDAIVYRLDLRGPDRLRTWWIRIEAGYPTGELHTLRIALGSGDPVVISSPGYAATILVREGERTEKMRTKLPITLLETGLFGGCEAIQPYRGRDREDFLSLAEDDPETFGEVTRAIATLFGLLRLVKANEILAPILDEVVQKPSVLSVLLNFGISVTVQPDIHRAEPWTEPLQIAELGEEPAYRMPLIVAVNDTPALLCSLLVVEPHSPLALGSGIVSAVGVNPSRPDVHVHLQLVGAHRGWAHVGPRHRR